MSHDNAMTFVAPDGTKPWDSSRMKLNVPNEVIVANILANIRRHLPQLRPHEPNAQVVALVGGGWSLEPTFAELRDLYFSGVKLVALNGAANWLLERNIRPALHIVMDAREGNLPFVSTPIPGCKYFLASQCHPALFDACQGRDVHIFHIVSSTSEEERQILNDHYASRWIEVPGAGTVGIVGILLMRILGFRFMHLFGIDSCYAPSGEHHAYAQSLNDGEGTGRFWCAGREFRCSAWQASQAHNFMQVVRHHGNLLQIAVHGDGLIAHMIKTGAEAQEMKEAENE